MKVNILVKRLKRCNRNTLHNTRLYEKLLKIPVRLSYYQAVVKLPGYYILGYLENSYSKTQFP